MARKTVKTELYAGTSGWAYTSWKPGFYPAKLGSAKFLEHYASRLNSVEVNYTFRRFASEAILDRWIAATPPHFKFSAKAHQGITHYKKLKGAEENTEKFLHSLEPLRAAGKLGMVLFQLPPFLKSDTVLLRDFLKSLPRRRRFAFEFRHDSWFNEGTYDALRKFNAAMCIAESEKLETPDVVTADFCYYRLRKPDYSDRTVKKVSRLVEAHLKCGRNVFIYFKHEDDPAGAIYAEKLLGMVNDSPLRPAKVRRLRSK